MLISEFLAYGSTVSDTQLSGDDRSSPRLRCFATIPFLGTTHSYRGTCGYDEEDLRQDHTKR
jgi:hypothetical protein